MCVIEKEREKVCVRKRKRWSVCVWVIEIEKNVYNSESSNAINLRIFISGIYRNWTIGKRHKIAKTNSFGAKMLVH